MHHRGVVGGVLVRLLGSPCGTGTAAHGLRPPAGVLERGVPVDDGYVVLHIGVGIVTAWFSHSTGADCPKGVV